jgi:HK97 gp10 family phage protein
MAGSVTVTGLSDVRKGVEALPRAVTLALRAVAWRTARRVHAAAKARLQASTHGTGATANALRVVERDQMKAFIVEVGPVPGRPANLPLWLELGTIKMRARPFLRPSMEEAHADYLREAEAAAVAVVAEALT